MNIYLMGRWLCLLLVVGVLTGCVQVAAWERGNLAKPQMALELHPLQANTRAHNYSSREAGANAHSDGGGGGCGCY
ncbi:MAG: DUF4266 domain-containing protein [Nitrosomonas sp.]|nr:DUF4266 domain-containing protein [Nitrosomonas sp.]